MTAALTAFDQIIDAAIRLPGVKVDRADYLRSALGRYVDDDVLAKAIACSPATAGVDASLLERAAQGSIKMHRLGATAASTAAGIPGGILLAGTVPADLTQYMYHTLVIAQKLAYLHGWPQLVGDDGDLDDETRLVLLSFVGVMFGSEAANQVVATLASRLAQHIARELPKKALTQFALFNIAKQVAKVLGVKLTKDVFGKSVAKAVPVLGGAVSGSLTWVTYGTMANRLNEHLAGLPLAQAR